MTHQLKLSKRYHKIGKPIPVVAHTYKQILLSKEFDDYQKRNYRTNPIKCICGNDNSYLISSVDREGWEYLLVTCKSCGLIRAKEYWDERSVNDFYSNWFWKFDGYDENPDKLYNDKYEARGKQVFDYVNSYTIKFNKPYVVFDVGGATGGVLTLFQKEANCYLFDYQKPFLEKARNMGITTIEGGIYELAEVNRKPDLVILSEVLEHIPDLDKALKSLRLVLSNGSLVYISLPGIDSLKRGRKSYDFLDDIHKPHVYYFSSEVLNNLMCRYGFKCLKSNSRITALYEYTGEFCDLINYYDYVVSDIRSAEIKRILLFRHIVPFIKSIVPRAIVIFVRKMFPQRR